MIKKWSQEDVDLSIEKQIIAGMILSDSFMRKIRKSIDIEYFQSDYCKIISNWCIQYFDEYDLAPKKHIQDIFLVKTQSIDPETIEMVSIFLTNLSDSFSNEESIKQYTTDYIINKTENYFQLRSATLKLEKANKLLNQGKIEQLVLELSNFSQIKINITKGVEPISDFELLQEAFEESEAPLLKLDGALGEFIGPLYRKFFLAIAGPAKRGKSYLMNEISIEAVKKGLNVAYFSMGDMTSKQMSKRTAEKLSARSARRGGLFVFPIRDCFLNQFNTCTDTNRTNKIKLVNPKGEKPKIDEAPKNYKVCTKCYDKNDLFYKKSKYKPEFWYKTRELKQLTSHEAISINKKFMRQYKGRYINYFWGRDAASISDVKAILDLWEIFTGFIPDIIITDYADIMRPDRDTGTERGNINSIWKAHDALAKDRDVLLITGTHTNKGTFDKNIEQKDISDDIRKMNHVNACIALNQTGVEKENKVMRVGYLFARDDDFGLSKECVLLQQLDVGQFCLDSFLI